MVLTIPLDLEIFRRGFFNLRTHLSMFLLLVFLVIVKFISFLSNRAFTFFISLVNRFSAPLTALHVVFVLTTSL